VLGVLVAAGLASWLAFLVFVSSFADRHGAAALKHVAPVIRSFPVAAVVAAIIRALRGK
jgi:hypothetical protein